MMRAYYMLLIFKGFAFLQMLLIIHKMFGTKENAKPYYKLDVTTEQFQIFPEERERFDWMSIFKPCERNMTWVNRTFGKEHHIHRTNAHKSVIIYKDIKDIGFYSKIILQTKTSEGKTKKFGGDFWQVIITGTAFLSGFARDLMDGSYEISFLINEPGNYTLNLILEHSLCDGLRDPPDYWFKSGIYGEFQNESILGDLDDFLVQRISPLHFSINQTAETNERMLYKPPAGLLNGNGEFICFENKSNIDHNCYKTNDLQRNCKFLQHSYGRWKVDHGKYKWIPNFPIALDKKFKKNKKFDTLWFYGDSTMYRLWDSSYTRVLCRQVFKHCDKTYNWLYPRSKYDRKGAKKNVEEAFNYTKFFNPMYEVFALPEMKTNRSVILVNFGLHLVTTITFKEYKSVLERFITMIEELKKGKHSSKFPHVIWKTTTITHKENTKIWNLTQSRFMTNHRIKLFNAYTNTRLCSEGIPISDAYPISASYPKGTKDHVHYHLPVFEPLEDTLADFIWKQYDD